jgi:hypothetical protein
MAILGLTVGINAYPNSPLKGCVPDAIDWAELLTGQGAEVISLHDKAANRAAMLDSIADLLGEAGPDDLAVLTYSGHGTQVPDRDGDELDRLDEAIVPVDYPSAGMIADDELYRLFSPAVHCGVRVVAVFDSCFSGTIQRFAGPLAEAVGDGGPVSPRAARWLPPAVWMDPADADTVARAGQQPRGKPKTSALAFTACRDNQVAYDAYLGGRYRGAYTAAALQAWDALRLTDAHRPPTYRQWHAAIRTLLPSSDFDQVPQLDGTSSQKRWLAFDEHGRR